jgi:hypothetical protein
VSPTKLPVPIADVFDSRYEGQLPFSYLRSPDFSFLRRKGEGFEQRGDGFSSGYENSNGMQDGSSGLREFSSAVDNGELDNGELVSSPHNGIDDGEHVPLASEQSSSSIDDGEHVHLSCLCFENFCVNNLIFFSSSSARSRCFPYRGVWSSWHFIGNLSVIQRINLLATCL